ncbi:Rrf2 family transcriptional regulator [Neisseria leonii]|uniref:Rrf2 family transcriptional regulator n=1 Tax=Neisseria leonii TaxID=2995413 RepID=A0A9X4E319_9NEIS|nr:Rrf2 family transcriptional regulator [Neisseria sp. 51.81]MDD9328761.1 Rrf2 family transcriptional regulator [Neisseria sp. 51.81]
MYITQHTDFALRVLIYTAAHEGKLVNIAEIADAYRISKSHLMKVVTALVKGGFLHSIRGKGGGLQLAAPAEQIRIGAVIRHLEPVQLVECMGEGSQCVISGSCRLAVVLDGAAQAFFNHLDSFTLADMLNRQTVGILVKPVKNTKGVTPPTHLTNGK